MKKIFYLIFLIFIFHLPIQILYSKQPKEIKLLCMDMVIKLVLIDTDNDDSYDYYVLFVHGQLWEQGPLLLRGKTQLQEDPFPDNSYVVINVMDSCVNHSYFFEWNIYNIDSVLIANFSNSCHSDTSFYDYLETHDKISSNNNNFIGFNENEISLILTSVNGLYFISSQKPINLSRIEFYDLQGKIVFILDQFNYKLAYDKFIINISNLSQGPYFCVVFYDNCIATLPLIKN